MANEIEELQTRLAFQEDLIATLNDQVALQDRDIKTLQAQLREVHQKLKELIYQVEVGGSTMPGDERPPHY